MKRYTIDEDCLRLAGKVCEPKPAYRSAKLSGDKAKGPRRTSRELGIRFVDFLSDYGFKIGFGVEEAKDDMLGLVNAILHKTARMPAKLLEFKNNEMPGTTKLERDALFDTHFIDGNNRSFNMEMQKWYFKFMLNRLSFYVSRREVASVRKGSDDKFDVGPFIGIAIINFVLFDDEPCVVDIREAFTHSNGKGPDHRSMIIIQLPKFTKKIDALTDDFDKYLFLLANMGKFKKIPPQFNNDKFRPLFERARIANFKKEDMKNFIEQEKKSELFRMRLSGAEEMGMERGMEKGIEKGIEKKAIEFINFLLASTMKDKKEIAQIVGVPLTLVEKVIADKDSKATASK